LEETKKGVHLVSKIARKILGKKDLDYSKCIYKDDNKSKIFYHWYQYFYLNAYFNFRGSRTLPSQSGPLFHAYANRERQQTRKTFKKNSRLNQSCCHNNHRA